jgi:AAA domain, putative AbiEii toxin, Type IV TA system/AAA domain
MAHVSEIFVKGLAGNSAGRYLNLNRDVNVFFGLNGTGKTSLLRLIHSGLMGRARDLKRIALTEAWLEVDDVIAATTERRYVRTKIRRVVENVETNRDQLRLNAELLGHSGQISTLESRRWKLITEASLEKGLEIRHTYLPISRLYTADDRPLPRTRRETSSEHGGISEVELERIFAETIHFLWLRYTRNLGLEVQMAQSEGLSNILSDFLAPDELIAGEYPQPDPSQAYKRLMAFLDRHSRGSRPMITEAAFAHRVKTDPRLHRVIKDIEDVETKVEFIRNPRSEFTRILSDMLSKGKDIRLGERDIQAFANGDDIGLENLSSGEKQLLRICVDVLLADGEPVLIDEPELSMHIDWQRKLIPALRDIAPKSQLIIATHSPEIMAAISERQIFEL